MSPDLSLFLISLLIIILFLFLDIIIRKSLKKKKQKADEWIIETSKKPFGSQMMVTNRQFLEQRELKKQRQFSTKIQEPFVAQLMYIFDLIANDQWVTATAICEFIDKYPERFSKAILGQKYKPEVARCRGGISISIKIILYDMDEIEHFSAEFRRIAHKYGLSLK